MSPTQQSSNNEIEIAKYEFDLIYEAPPSESKSLFPYKFSYSEYPQHILGNVISKHEYQNIIELLLMNDPPHFIFYGYIPLFLTGLLIISILLIQSAELQTISNFLLVIFIISLLSLPFSIYKLVKLLLKKRSISNELEKRNIQLKATIRVRKYNLLFVLITYAQLIIDFIFFCIKYGVKEVISQEIFQYGHIIKSIFITLTIIDVILIIYLIYNLILFSKYRDILSNSTQSDHLNYLIQNIKKFDSVPFYLSYPLNGNTNYQDNQPLLLQEV